MGDDGCSQNTSSTVGSKSGGTGRAQDSTPPWKFTGAPSSMPFQTRLGPPYLWVPGGERNKKEDEAFVGTFLGFLKRGTFGVPLKGDLWGSLEGDLLGSLKRGFLGKGGAFRVP